MPSIETGVALGPQALSHLVRAGERLLGRDVVAVGTKAAEIGRAGFDKLGPPVGEVRRNLYADIWHQPLALRDESLHLVDRHIARPVREGRGGRGRLRNVGRI